MTKALLIIDIQNDYFPGGANELVGIAEAAAVAVKVKAHFKSQGLPVIMVQHIAIKPGATFFLPDTYGAELHESLPLEEGDELVVKHFPNSFRETTLLEVLKNLNVTDLTIVGMMTHMCVDTTVRAANDLGYQVTLVADACATRDLEFAGARVAAAQVQTSYLAAIDGSFASVVSAASVLGP